MEPMEPMREAAKALMRACMSALRFETLLVLMGGRRALAKVPGKVAAGFNGLGGSDTERSEGTLRGRSLFNGSAGDSSGVLASEETPEPGDVGLPSPSLSAVSSGVAGIESDMAREYAWVVVKLCRGHHGEVREEGSESKEESRG
jgi:hypothetical protein